MKRFGTSARRGRAGNAVGWFAVWLAVGAALAFLLVALVGLLVLPFAVVGVAVLAVRHRLDRSAWGLTCGAGVLCLYVAYLQRRGPGTVTWHTATASGAATYLDPRPWLIAGLLLIAVGLVALLWHRRNVGTSKESPQR